IASRANAEPRMVRELRELQASPASPLLLARELWLDRAAMILIIFYIIFQLMTIVRAVFDISFFWAFIPLFLFFPFFLFYAKSVVSQVSSFKEPDEVILSMAAAITGVKRIVFGHTHRACHEILGPVEHLNSGCWSPAFKDIECTQPIDKKTYVWISPGEGGRRAELLRFKDNAKQKTTS
ncbi:MAG: hypothetical protein N2578_01485, partial [Bdellovibrionaceae bacterium]|nr:hypothetical protein [Pseudobdellovibrionaceae bacterium]